MVVVGQASSSDWLEMLSVPSIYINSGEPYSHPRLLLVDNRKMVNKRSSGITCADASTRLLLLVPVPQVSTKAGNGVHRWGAW
jgi:hypothetical protein